MSNLSVGKGVDAPIMYKAGSVIFGEKQASKYLYILKKGEIRLVKSKAQHLTVIKLCKEKEILNEESVLTAKPTEFAAIAKTDVELVLVDQKDILSVIKGGPSWIPEIFETLCERLKSTQDIIEEHNLTADKGKDMLLTKEEEKKYLAALHDHKN